MKKSFLYILFLLGAVSIYSQVKIRGVVLDAENETIPFANVVFVNSTVGTVSDENGHFYLESDITYSEIEVSFIGYESKRISVQNRDLNLEITLVELSDQLDEVVIYSGRIKNKGNPAVAIVKNHFCWC